MTQKTTDAATSPERSDGWLFMLYLSGDNNLSPEMIRALMDIEAQGLPRSCEMTILYDGLSPCCPSYVYDLTGRRESGPMGAEGFDPLQSAPLPFTNQSTRRANPSFNPRVYKWFDETSNPDTLREFVRWSIDAGASQHRMLILSGHGSGAIGDFLPDQHGSNGVPGSLTIPGLRHALAGFTLDVLGMDACLMSMAEVAFELRESVEFLVGSEGNVVDAGWPYGRLLDAFRKDFEQGTVDGRKLTASLVTKYIEHYREYLPAGVSVDLAACELAQLGDDSESAMPSYTTTESTGKQKTEKTPRKLTAALNELSRILRSELARPDSNDEEALARWRSRCGRVILAHWRAQSYKAEQYTDLWDFCDQLQDLTNPEEELWKACEDIKTAIDIAVGRDRDKGDPGRQDYEGIAFQHSHGLSVYFPWSCTAFDEAKQAYKALKFAVACKWDEFLADYVTSTRRELRRPDDRTAGVSTLAIFGLDSPDGLAKADKEERARRLPVGAGHAFHVSSNALFPGREGPRAGRMLAALFQAATSESTKNPPTSVYLRTERDRPGKTREEPPTEPPKAMAAGVGSESRTTGER